MLAKNEAAHLPKLAQATAGQIDSWLILLDESTTDDTAEVAAQVFGHLPGRIVTAPWVDFCTARNHLYELARDAYGDYILLLDPDSPLKGTIPRELTELVYSIALEQGGTDWRVPLIFRSDVDVEWIGRVHEYASFTAPITPLEGVTIEPAWVAKPERYERDAELLAEDASTNPRSAFYLAQTYETLGRSDEAIAQYLRRAQMGDGSSIEETFVALLRAGALLLPLDVELARVLLERAHGFRPNRPEPLYYLAWLSNWEGKHPEAGRWAKLGLDQGPCTDALFVNRWQENEGLQLEYDKAVDSLIAAA